MKNSLSNSSDVDTFLKAIQGELEAGYGFVPLVGAGLSAESGVPLIPDMRAYLSKCISSAIGIYSHPDEKLKRRWYPATDAWPSITSISEDDEIETYNLLGAELKKLKESSQYYPEIPLIQEAQGALADWRSALMFLARLTRVDSESAGRELRLGTPNYDVIDAFFRHTTGGKSPSLPHLMLALLSQPMRFDVLLTTNFDELTEEAFRESGIPIDPIDVHIHAALPSARHLGNRRSLVKLHGGRYGLRADYTLDADPTPQEQKNFLSYFKREKDSKDDTNFNHLLVIGMAAQDKRTVDFISHVVKENPDFKIFWICYSKADYDNITQVLKDKRRFGDRFDNGIHVLRHQFTGLFLLQLWQHLTHTLPPKFAIFPSATRISTPPCDLTPLLKKLDERIAGGNDESGKKIEERAQTQFYGTERLDNRLIRVSAGYNQYGVVSKAAHHYYRALHKGRKCVWLSMENVASTDELFEHLTDAIARKAGVRDWMPVVLYDQKEKAIGEITRLTRGRSKWVIFLDARDGAGTAIEPYLKQSTHPNGWLDRSRVDDDVDDGKERKYVELIDGSNNSEEFAHLIQKLSGPECPQVSVVLTYHKEYALEEERPEEESEDTPILKPTGLEKTLNASGFSDVITVVKGISHISEQNLDQKDEYEQCEAVSKINKWTEDSDDQQKLFFLLGLCSVQRTRYPTLLMSDAFFSPLTPISQHDEDLESRYKNIKDWTSELALHANGPALRVLPGGFIWMHSSLKEKLRDEFGMRFRIDLPDDEELELEVEKETEWKSKLDADLTLRQSLARVHSLLARWYDRLFLSSNDPQAGLEAIFHFLTSASNSANFYLASDIENWKTGFAGLGDEPWESLCASITSSELMLDRIHSITLSSGFPKASCRRLIFLRCHTIEKLKGIIEKRIEDSDEKQIEISRLNSMSRQMIAITRGIAQEVSEHTRAFQRHRQLLEFKVNEEVKTTAKFPESADDFVKQSAETKKLRRELLLKIEETGEADDRLFYSRWERRNSVLKLATRAYPSAGHTICSAIRSNFNIEGAWKEPETEGRRTLRAGYSAFSTIKLEERQPRLREIYDEVLEDMESITKLDFSELHQQDRLIVELAKGMCRIVQWLVVFVEITHFSNRCTPHPLSTEDNNDLKEKALRIAITVYQKFEELRRQIPGRKLSSASYRSVSQIMETQMSSIFAVQNRFRIAHECLEKATELRPQLDQERNNLSAGIVDLHRTQAFLIHALSEKGLPLANPDGDESLISSTRNLLGPQSDSGLLFEVSESFRNQNGFRHDKTDCLIEQFNLYEVAISGEAFEEKDDGTLEIDTKVSRKIKSIRRLISDAETTAKKAERVLVSKRKNVWWSTWLFELQIKVVEYRLVVSIYEASLQLALQARRLHGTSEADEEKRRTLYHQTFCELIGKKQDRSLAVPDFGSVSCPRNHKTATDYHLINTLRMVRLDLIRLSRVVESYTYCYRGLSILTILNPELERLPSRLEMMHNLLSESDVTQQEDIGADAFHRGAISSLDRRRKERFGLPPTIDPLVAAYSNHVVDFATQVKDRGHLWK